MKQRYILFALMMLVPSIAHAASCTGPLSDARMRTYGNEVLANMRTEGTWARPALSLNGVPQDFWRRITDKIYNTDGGLRVQQPYNDAIAKANLDTLQACFPGLEGLLAEKRQIVRKEEENANAKATADEARRLANRDKLKTSFEIDTGFTAENILEMQQRMGLSTDEANSIIWTLGHKLDDLEAFKEGSNLYQSLTLSQGGAAFANRLFNLVKAGDRIGAVNDIIRTFAGQDRGPKVMLSKLFGVPLSVLENYASAAAVPAAAAAAAAPATVWGEPMNNGLDRETQRALRGLPRE